MYVSVCERRSSTGYRLNLRCSSKVVQEKIGKENIVNCVASVWAWTAVYQVRIRNKQTLSRRLRKCRMRKVAERLLVGGYFGPLWADGMPLMPSPLLRLRLRRIMPRVPLMSSVSGVVLPRRLCGRDRFGLSPPW